MENRLEQVKARTIIIKEGEPCRAIYKNVSGRVVLYKDYGKESELIIRILSQSHYFGELSVLPDRKSPYTAVAHTDTMLMKINADELEDYIKSYPANAVAIIKELASNTEAVNKHIELFAEEMQDILAMLPKSDAEKSREILEKIEHYRFMGMGAVPPESGEKLDRYV